MSAPAKPYLMLLDRIHQYLVPRTYLEVGVSTGRSLALALPGTLCVGVDPAPVIQVPISSTSRIYSLTSDAFFDEIDVCEALGNQPVDLGFIDGLHHFEFALRDFMNIERYGSSKTAVLIHDCLPPDEASASRTRTPPHWTGDVWKTVLCLREWRPDLEVAVADVGPTGLGIVTGLDPSSQILHDHYQEILEHYLGMPFSRFESSDKESLLGLVPGDWERIRPLLPLGPMRDGDLTTLKARRLLLVAAPAARRWARAFARRAYARLRLTRA